jgi:predicted tellurium resistance membrane protein TerC
VKSKVIKSLYKAIIQILVIDFIFSIDSILTAAGMTNGLHQNHNYNLLLMIIAVVISIAIIIIIIIIIRFANTIRKFIESNPSMEILGLSFLILIGFMLVTEAAHLSHTEFFENTVGAVPKGYLYFAIGFPLSVEFLNYKTVEKNNE